MPWRPLLCRLVPDVPKCDYSCHKQMPLSRSHSLLPSNGFLAFVPQNGSNYTHSTDIHANTQIYGRNLYGNVQGVFNHLMTCPILGRFAIYSSSRVLGFFISAIPSCLLTARMFNVTVLGAVLRGSTQR